MRGGGPLPTDGVVEPGTQPWTRPWIPRPYPILDGYRGCGLCRALTPPEHDEVLGRGQGPAQEAVGGGTRTGVDEKQWRHEKDGLRSEDRRSRRTEQRGRERRDGSG